MKTKFIFGSMCLVWMAVQLSTRYIFPINYLHQRYIFLIFSFMTVFFPFIGEESKRKGYFAREIAFFLLAIAAGVYLYLSSGRYAERWEFVSPVFALDVVAMFVVLTLMLVATYRITGWPLVIFTFFMLFYGFFGFIFPGIANHQGLSLEAMTDVQLMGASGTFGMAAGVCVEFIFYFVVFGAMFNAFGGGDLLTKIGLALTSKSVGGPAKSAVIASSLMGSVSGSAVANVVLTGTFTIPLMKETGVEKNVAGAVEAAASTGGQILPPVMGAGAFIMAETLGVKYLEICSAAILPALLYYAALFLFVHFYSKRQKIGTAAELIKIKRKEIFEKIHLLIPLISLIYFIVRGYSVGMSVIYSTIILVALGFLRKTTRPSCAEFVNAIISGMKQSASVGIPIFICGVTIGIAIYSGIALKATNLIVSYGKDNIMLALVLGVFVTIILGMGLPTSAAYVVASLFVVPVFTKCGILPIAAHMFIFYYAVLGQVTPPVAMAAYTAAGIAKGNPIRTSWIAFGLCLPAFLIPFTFVFNPALLMRGSVFEIVYAFVATFIGCAFLALCFSKYSRANLAGIKMLAYQLLLLTAAFMLINPNIWADVLGLSIGGCAILLDWFVRRKQAAV